VIPPVGHSRSRVRRDGKIRYTAYYDDIGGQRRSAGTYPTRREADKAWRSAEVKVAEGRVGTLRRSRRRFGDYVREEWLPNHVIELTTRQNYTYQLERRILPFFENMPMMEILPANVRQWVAKLRADGVKPPTIRYCTTVLSAIFTTALNDQITFLHPCVGVRTPPVARRPRRIITPEQFALIHAAIPSDELRLLVETDIETGLRWGELTELRAKDFDSSASTLLISRVVVEVTPTFAPNGQRFVVKHYPKDEEWRSLDLTRHIADLLARHVEHLHPNELLFPAPQPSSPMQRHQRQPTDPEALGMTVPNAKGRTYRHGTLSGYSAGRCKCEHCRGAYARYRAKRRAAGADPTSPTAAIDHRRAYPAIVVPPPGVEARTRSRRDRLHRPGPRPAARTRFVVAQRGRRPRNSQGAHGPHKHYDHRELPPHPPRRGSEGSCSDRLGARASNQMMASELAVGWRSRCVGSVSTGARTKMTKACTTLSTGRAAGCPDSKS
jgi:integrase